MEYAKTGESVKSSWIKANEYVAGLNNNQKDALAANYAVLTHYGDVQYSRFPGFPGNTYGRPDSSSKKILRFRRNIEVDLIKEEMKIEQILMDDAISDNEEEMVVAYTVTFPHIYDGCTVEGDKLVAIVDGEGVKYTAVNWSEIQG